MSLTAKAKLYTQSAVIGLMVLFGISPAAALPPPEGYSVIAIFS